MLTSIDLASLDCSTHNVGIETNFPPNGYVKFNLKDLGNISHGALGSDDSRKRRCCQVFQRISFDALSTTVAS